jgi:hypothetical protein
MAGWKNGGRRRALWAGRLDIFQSGADIDPVGKSFEARKQHRRRHLLASLISGELLQVAAEERERS